MSTSRCRLTANDPPFSTTHMALRFGTSSIYSSLPQWMELLTSLGRGGYDPEFCLCVWIFISYDSCRRHGGVINEHRGPSGTQPRGRRDSHGSGEVESFGPCLVRRSYSAAGGA